MTNETCLELEYLVEPLNYVAAILEANAAKFSVPNHIRAKARRVREAASAIQSLSERIAVLEGLIANPPKHRFWGAGEPDCPREIKARNGEVRTLRCKVCGIDSPRDDFCRASLTPQEPK